MSSHKLVGIDCCADISRCLVVHFFYIFSIVNKIIKCPIGFLNIDLGGGVLRTSLENYVSAGILCIPSKGVSDVLLERKVFKLICYINLMKRCSLTQPPPMKLHKSDPNVIRTIVIQTGMSPTIIQRSLQDHSWDVTETVMDLLIVLFDKDQ